MDQNLLIESWKREQTQPFAGWDFSYLHGRLLEEQPDWSYEQRAAELLQGAGSVLDMETGGGERLLSLRAHWPAKVAATEHYPPNVRLATERLAPLGVQVLDVEVTDSALLPCADDEFELVLNRHGSLNPAEVARVLAPGGCFYTQQVHGLWAADLIAAFGATPAWPDSTPEKYLPLLRAAGLQIVDARDWRGELVFTDVGALVYYLRAVPWLVAGFSVETHVEYLLKLQAQLEQQGRLVFSARKYMIEARKTGMVSKGIIR